MTWTDPCMEEKDSPTHQSPTDAGPECPLDDMVGTVWSMLKSVAPIRHTHPIQYRIESVERMCFFHVQDEEILVWIGINRSRTWATKTTSPVLSYYVKIKCTDTRWHDVERMGSIPSGILSKPSVLKTSLRVEELSFLDKSINGAPDIV